MITMTNNKKMKMILMIRAVMTKMDNWPVGDDAIAAALPVGHRGVAEQLVLTGIQRHQ